MSVIEATDNRVNTWGMADGTKVFTAFSVDDVRRVLPPGGFKPDESQACLARLVNMANEQIATGQVHRFLSVEAMIESLGS